MIEEGYYRNDMVEGLTTQTLTNGERYVVEYKNGKVCGSITGYLPDGKVFNAISTDGVKHEFMQVITGKPESVWFKLEPKVAHNTRMTWLQEHLNICRVKEAAG